MLAEGLRDKEFVAQLHHNSVHPMYYGPELEKPFVQANTDNKEVQILSSKAVLFSKQRPHNAGNLHETLTPARAPLLPTNSGPGRYQSPESCPVFHSLLDRNQATREPMAFKADSQPSSLEGPYYDRRSETSPTKPCHTVQCEYSQANLHKQDAEQQVLASLSNRKPEMAQYSLPEVKPCRDQVNLEPRPDHASDLPSVPEVSQKPIVDVVLRVIKRQTATIPAVNNAKKSVVKDSSIQTSPDPVIASPVTRETSEEAVSVSNEVQSGTNHSSANHKLANIVTNNSLNAQQSKLQPNATLQPSDLTTTGETASKQVQLLVDTGACVSAIDETFVRKTYGQFLPKMTDGSLPSVQTISGDTVPLLGKITIPLKLNGFEYSCGFHVMTSLAFDAILGRDFLQRHRAWIDLETNSLTFKGSADVRKKRNSASDLPAMGTFLSKMTNVESDTSIEADP